MPEPPLFAICYIFLYVLLCLIMYFYGNEIVIYVDFNIIPGGWFARGGKGQKLARHYQERHRPNLLVEGDSEWSQDRRFAR